MEDATKEDGFGGFDGDLYGLPLGATNGPETKIARVSGNFPSEELAKKMSYFRIGE